MAEWTTLKLILGIVYKCLEALVMLLPDLIQMGRAIASYWILKNQRLKDAMQEEINAKLRAAEAQSRKEQANLKASLAIYAKVWKDTYKQLLEYLNSDKPEDALIMVKEQNFEAVSQIIFFNTSANEIKAQLITDLMKKTQL